MVDLSLLPDGGASWLDASEKVAMNERVRTGAARAIETDVDVAD